jgi:hypothetical protein
MRKSVAFLCVIGASASGATTAVAGEPTVTPGGDFAVVDVEVLPPIASERGTPRGVRLDIREFIGNRRTGSRPEVTGAMGFRFPRGMTFHGALFAKCRTDAAQPADCPAAARIGTGSIELDARPAAPDPTNLQLLAYNGARRSGRATIIFFALAGEAVLGKQVGELRAAGVGGFGTVLAFDRPESPPAFTITRLRLRTRDRAVSGRAAGHRVRRHFIEAPRACSGSWPFASYQELADRRFLTSTDTTSCVRG